MVCRTRKILCRALSRQPRTMYLWTPSSHLWSWSLWSFAAILPCLRSSLQIKYPTCYDCFFPSLRLFLLSVTSPRRSSLLPERGTHHLCSHIISDSYLHQSVLSHRLRSSSYSSVSISFSLVLRWCVPLIRAGVTWSVRIPPLLYKPSYFLHHISNFDLLDTYSNIPRSLLLLLDLS